MKTYVAVTDQRWYGFLADYRQLPLGAVWQELGEANGVASLEGMRRSIGRYRRRPLDPYEEPVIGCAMLRDTVFFGTADLRPTPEDFPPATSSGARASRWGRGRGPWSRRLSGGCSPTRPAG